VQKADIFLDQFVLGDHGMAALEAMAFGKPVVCYIKPTIAEKYPNDCPIVNANQDNLSEVLESLLNSGKLRYDIGRKSRSYVEKYHDTTVLANKLLDIYKEIMVKKDRL
jgi:glycosyltransferase involved in cell wall biosynthesis